MSNLLKAIFGYCPKHGWFHRSKTFKMCCSYEEESNNWMYGCRLCEEEADDYWEDMWKNI